MAFSLKGSHKNASQLILKMSTRSAERMHLMLQLASDNQTLVDSVCHVLVLRHCLPDLTLYIPGLVDKLKPGRKRKSTKNAKCE